MSGRAGKIVGAKWHDTAVAGHDVDAAILQSFKVNVPDILESHCRNAQQMSA